MRPRQRCQRPPFVRVWNSAGHVHAYERSKGGIIGGKIDRCAPSFVTIGDGGNRSGLASYHKGQIAKSSYRNLDKCDASSICVYFLSFQSWQGHKVCSYSWTHPPFPSFCNKLCYPLSAYISQLIGLCKFDEASHLSSLLQRGFVDRNAGPAGMVWSEGAKLWNGDLHGGKHHSCSLALASQQRQCD